MKTGQKIEAVINYPKNPKLDGIYKGTVTEVGRFRNGFAYFKLDTNPKLALPASSQYCWTNQNETKLDTCEAEYLADPRVS